MAEDHAPQDSQKMEDKPSYVPASPAKRAAAWVGVVYMVLIVLLTAYHLGTGQAMNGIAGLMLAPAAGGFSVVSAMRVKKAGSSAEKVKQIAIALLSFFLFCACVIWGGKGLLANLGVGG